MTNRTNNQFATITETTTMHLTMAPPIVDCGIDGTVCDDMGMANFIADALSDGYDCDAHAYDCAGIAVVVTDIDRADDDAPHAFTMNNAFTELMRMGFALTWGDDLPPHVTDDPNDAVAFPATMADAHACPKWSRWLTTMADQRTRVGNPW